MSSSNLKCSLIKSLPDSSVEDTVGILSSNGRGYDLKISFRRTIRVPDNTYASELPLGLGKFPLYSATKYKANLPEDMGIKEDFSSQCTQFAIKVYLGGVNAISGEPKTENPASTLRRLQRKSEGRSVQDYVVTPKQLWLDGIASSNGRVRQFIAMPMGFGYSVEAQMTDKEFVGGLQFEITPPKPMTLIPRTLARDPSEPLPRTAEISIAPGGLIKQCIINDTYPATSWDSDRTITFNVQILDSETFRDVTGMDPPKTPINAETYASQGLPFFKIYNETSTIKGDFAGLKSIKQKEKEKTKKGAREDDMDEPSYKNPIVVLNSDGGRMRFRPLSELETKLSSMNSVQF